MKEYNGHRSYNAWNVSLWLSNDENLYLFCMDCINEAKKRNTRYWLNIATRKVMACIGGTKTPDGAVYTKLSVKLALESLAE